jgi:O-antigen/teichoic acid export membrane protein
VATAWLGLGFFLNAMVSNAYIASVACAQPRIPLIVNLIGGVFYLPGLYWAVTRFGIAGAGASYAALNAFYIVTLVPLVQGRVVRQGYGPWLLRNLLPYVLAGTVTFGLARLVPLEGASSIETIGVIAMAATLYAAAAGLAMSRSLRQDLFGTARRLLGR